jgi:hypothetical protein
VIAIRCSPPVQRQAAGPLRRRSTLRDVYGPVLDELQRRARRPAPERALLSFLVILAVYAGVALVLSATHGEIVTSVLSAMAFVCAASAWVRIRHRAT